MKKLARHVSSGFLALGLAVAAGAMAADAPSRTGVDAPQLAALGKFAVGVRSVTLVQHDQLDLRSMDPKTGTVPRGDRSLQIEIWYPAKPMPGAVPAVYEDSLESEPPAPPAKFRIQGLAVRDAPADGGRFPLVVVAHGFGNVPVAMSWLTENLASKGYVVAAIRHDDLYLAPVGFPHAALRRPLDIAFVTRELQRTLGEAGSVDPSQTALLGYSMGGYGVLTAAGAALDPAGALVTRVPGGLLAPYARGGELSAAMIAPSVKAVVAIAPAGGAFGAWAPSDLQGITAPLLLIAGDHDRTVDYKTGARAFFDQATNSNRYLLTFLGGGHALGLGPAPPEMQQDLWNQDWFEDPVWRKDRLIGVSLHFITAFLDLHLKGDASRRSFIEGLVVESSSGEWTSQTPIPWNAYSPGGEGITLWKGFQRRHADGLTLLHQEAATAR